MSLDPFQKALVAALEEQARKIKTLEKRLAAVEAVEPKQFFITDDTPEEVVEYLQRVVDMVSGDINKFAQRMECFDQHLLEHEKSAARLGTTFLSANSHVVDEIVKNDEEALRKPR